MTTVTVSPKYQVVIPKNIREAIGLKVGESLQIIQYGSRIELIPIKGLRTMQGFLKGMDTSLTREEDRF